VNHRTIVLVAAITKQISPSVWLVRGLWTKCG